jgi:hypothetical protein
MAPGNALLNTVSGRPPIVPAVFQSAIIAYEEAAQALMKERQNHAGRRYGNTTATRTSTTMSASSLSQTGNLGSWPDSWSLKE